MVCPLLKSSAQPVPTLSYRMIPPPVVPVSLFSFKNMILSSENSRIVHFFFLNLRNVNAVYLPAEGSLVFRKEMNMKVSILWNGSGLTVFSLFSIEIFFHVFPLSLSYPYNHSFSGFRILVSQWVIHKLNYFIHYFCSHFLCPRLERPEKSTERGA